MALGVVALLCYAVHGAYHVYHRNPENLLWVCHLGAALIGVGLLFDARWLSAIGTLFLCLGTPQWLLYLVSGGEFMPTSLATHVVALGIGLYAAHRYGMPRGAWWKALVGLVILIFLSRIFTPIEANVNMAFAVQQGFESAFPSYPFYIEVLHKGQALYSVFSPSLVSICFVCRRHFGDSW